MEARSTVLKHGPQQACRGMTREVLGPFKRSICGESGRWDIERGGRDRRPMQQLPERAGGRLAPAQAAALTAADANPRVGLQSSLAGSA